MTISIHCQTIFNDYNFFKSTLDQILDKYPNIQKCLTGRTTPTKFSKRYFLDKNIVCEQPKLSNLKIQRQYKIVEISDLCIFFYNKNTPSKYNITGKTLVRANNLKKEIIVFEYKLLNADNES